MSDRRDYVHVGDCLALLRLIGRQNGATLADLMQAIGSSRATVVRLIRSAREQLDCNIQWIGAPATPGRYVIADWGLLNGARIRRKK